MLLAFNCGTGGIGEAVVGEVGERLPIDLEDKPWASPGARGFDMRLANDWELFET